MQYILSNMLFVYNKKHEIMILFVIKLISLNKNFGKPQVTFQIALFYYRKTSTVDLTEISKMALGLTVRNGFFSGILSRKKAKNLSYK